jgi:predicted metalloprotease
MRWKGRRKSSNVEDRRGTRVSGGLGGGGGLLRLLPVVYKFLGFKGTAIVALGFVGYVLFTGGDLSTLLGSSPSVKTTSGPIKQSESEKQLAEFMSVVLADTEDTWTLLFKQNGQTYKKPKLVLYRGAVQSACGFGQAAMGPFYCPGDQKVYIDLSFYDDLKRRYKAPGDFAQAYVLAHEVGHHVQTLTGISQKVQQAKARVSTKESNQLSVMMELQADCFAGVWAHHADRSRQILESGDIEEGLAAASAVGDDRLQKKAQGYANPDSFTHGSSEQRSRWFRIGLDKGSFRECDTFSAARL